jgi:ATP-dependent exoDNAse (exonuclease V) alpha subunit
MDDFLTEKSQKNTFILKGYAGTGKTSVLAALVKALPSMNIRPLMLAPTGRAAKVMGGYAGKTGFTIHKIIYKPLNTNSGEGFSLQKNYYQNTLVIVDEASMLADDQGSGNHLLRDLLDFVFEQHSNRLLLIGDDAQLPPVGSEKSPALDGGYLAHHFRLNVKETILTDVMRQQADSGILYNATNLRNELIKKQPQIYFFCKAFKDFFRMSGERLEDGLRYAYEKFGVDETIIITRSNKMGVQYNQYIRRTIFFYEEEISPGDRLMIVKNNYTYMEESEKINFLANGDFAEVMKIRSFEELYDLRFATVELRLVDYPDEPYFEAKIILDTLYSPTPGLEPEKWVKLRSQVLEDYSDLSSKSEIRESLRKDPYLNALQVKFAYALTCHKSQGGQWAAVFVDQGFLTDEQLDRLYIRWLYTAMTRAKEQLFMVNFHGKFFINEMK